MTLVAPWRGSGGSLEEQQQRGGTVETPPAPPSIRQRARPAVSRRSGGNRLERLRGSSRSDHRPAVLRLRLYEDAGELAAVDPDVVGPLDPAPDPRLQLLGRLADRERHRERQQQVALIQWAQDRRVEQRLVGGRSPAAPLPSPPRGLLSGGDDVLPARRPRPAQRARELVRVGDAEVL